MKNMTKLLSLVALSSVALLHADVVVRNNASFPVVVRINSGPWSKSIAAGQSQVFDANFSGSTIELFEDNKNDKKFEFEAGAHFAVKPACEHGEYAFDGKRFVLKATCENNGLEENAIYPR